MIYSIEIPILRTEGGGSAHDEHYNGIEHGDDTVSASDDIYDIYSVVFYHAVFIFIWVSFCRTGEKRCNLCLNFFF